MYPDDPGATPNSAAIAFSLWCCYWIEEGQTKKSHAKSAQRAKNDMLRRLEEGYPAWIVSVPGFDDDDIPF